MFDIDSHGFDGLSRGPKSSEKSHLLKVAIFERGLIEMVLLMQ